ncbi:MAG: hypothetical protein LKG11_05700 [Bacilli bacterium]|jgi:hypothetical protein|nr:hypothetical protein [Bacilli bacterium]
MNAKRKEPSNLTDGFERIELTPEDEKSILSSIKLESASFVPDKLEAIIKETIIKIEVLPAKEEKAILSSLNREGAAFVPNRLLAIQKATGVVPLPSDQESLAIHEKVKNEGEALAKKSESTVFQKTGTKRRWSFPATFRSNKIPWVGLVATTAASIALTIGLVSDDGDKALGTIAYVSLSVESASGYNANANRASIGECESGYVPNSANTYIPTFSFVTDGRNVAKANTISANNYSATLVKKKIGVISSDIEASSLIANKLLPSSYDLGYLETKNNKLRNNITVNVYCGNPDFVANYENRYQNAINAYLSENKIYSDVTFETASDSSIGAFINDVDSRKAERIVKAYSFLSDNGANDEWKTCLGALAKEDDDVLDALIDAFTATASSQLSDRALENVHDGIALAYYRYITDYSLAETEDAKKLQEALAKQLRHIASMLPWAQSGGFERQKSNLKDDSYYVISNGEWEGAASAYQEGMVSGIANQGDALAIFFHIRDLIMANVEDAGDFVDIMRKVSKRSRDFGTHAGAFPDDGEHDGGYHDHGNGNQGGDWGSGGGDWDEQDWMPNSSD